MTPIPHDFHEHVSVSPSPDELMTPEQFAEQMRCIAEQRDPEGRHGEADDLLCNVLTALGYSDGIAVFTEMVKWYA